MICYLQCIGMQESIASFIPTATCLSDCIDKGMKEAIHSSHLACQYPACYANNTGSVINSFFSVKTKAQTIVITEKKCSKKVQKLEKNWLRQGLNQQLSWLTTV